MTSIDDVIQPGQPIPDDVTRVVDNEAVTWILTSRGHWHLSAFVPSCATDTTCPAARSGPPSPEYAPFTVTAVREQPADVVPPEHFEEPVRIIEPLNVNGLIRDSREIMLLLGVTEAADVLPELTRRLAAPEPQQADASPVLDLVRQLRKMVVSDHAFVVDEADAMFESLHDRIAALVPQQPVQARGAFGVPLWQHVCGIARSWQKPDPNYCDSCEKPGPWRPLLVGGDPAPEQPAVVEAWKVALAERDAARAEVEHLNIAVSQEIETRDENAEWADRLANAIAAHLGVDIGEHSNMNLPWQAALLALEFTPSPQPDPLVLSLPEVPEGTEALVGVRPGGGSLRFVRHPRFAGWINDDYPDPSETEPLNTGTVLDLFGPVRVELAPPREPRTWPKLADEPDVLPQLVQVADHGQWTLKNGRLYVSVGKLYDEAHNLAQLRMLGDVTEVTG